MIKYVFLSAFCAVLIPSIAIADDVEMRSSEKVKKEYSDCLKGLKQGTLSKNRRSSCKIYVRAYDGGHSVGYAKGKQDTAFRGFIPLQNTTPVSNGGWYGHRGNPHANDVLRQFLASQETGGFTGNEGDPLYEALKNRVVVTDQGPSQSLGRIALDPKAIEAANLKFERLPNGDYLLTGE